MTRPENIEKGKRTSPLHSPHQRCDMVRLKIQESLGDKKMRRGEVDFVVQQLERSFSRERVGMPQMS